MANYYGAFRTNYFRITDEKRFYEICDGICCEDPYIETSEKDGEILAFIGGYSSFNYHDAETDECNDELFYQLMSDIIAPGDAMILTEVGNEKLRYLSTYSVVVTNEQIEFVDLEFESICKAQELLGDKWWSTKNSY